MGLARITSAYFRNTKTCQDGSYLFSDLPAAPDLLVQFYAPSEKDGDVGVKLFTTDAGPIETAEDKTWNCTLPSTSQTMTICGHVLGYPSGKPVAAAVDFVNTRTHSFAWTVIDPATDGAYRLILTAPASYEFSARYASESNDAGRAENKQIVPWAPGSTRTLDFSLPDPFSMSIRVIEADGQPVPDAQVEGVNGPIYIPTTRTDQEGRYGFDGFAPGLEAHFTIKKEGYSPAESSRITGQTGEVYPEEVVVLHRADSPPADPPPVNQE